MSKDLTPTDNPVRDNIQHDQVEVAPVLKQERRIGSLRRIKGLTLWELDVNKCEIRPAEIQSTVALGKELPTNKVKMKEGHWYDQALNIENAKKHFKRMAYSHLAKAGLKPKPEMWKRVTFEAAIKLIVKLTGETVK